MGRVCALSMDIELFIANEHKAITLCLRLLTAYHQATVKPSDH